VLTTLAARTLVAAALIAFALWRRDAAVGDRLALIASIVAVPVLATWRVAPLLALPRLLTLVGPYTDRAAATRPQPRYA
jgi:hypothetical protein